MIGEALFLGVRRPPHPSSKSLSLLKLSPRHHRDLPRGLGGNGKWRMDRLKDSLRRRGALLLALVFCIAFAAAAQAPARALQLCNGIVAPSDTQVRPLCSATWAMRANCEDGQDLWDKWKIVDGRTKPADSFIRPFESVPIDGVG
jgi:hypothetical protein